jgi:hypothetical protein
MQLRTTPDEREYKEKANGKRKREIWSAEDDRIHSNHL